MTSIFNTTSRGLHLLLLLTITFNSFGQNIIKGIVVDKENGIPLPDVQITCMKDNTQTRSNQLGEFMLVKKGNYTFSIAGYQTKQVHIKNSKFVIIQLRIHSLELNEVIINANHIPEKLKQSSSTIHILSRKEIDRSNHINISPVINRIPGIYMHSGTLNTNRITIRGIGSRNLYGTSKIRAYYQDIPLTSGNGGTNIEDFELNSISYLEILKGGTSSIYGSGLGGTIQLIPKKGLLNQSSIQSGVSFGSYGLIKGIIDVSYGSAKSSTHIIYSNTHRNGYRLNNQYDRQTITMISDYYSGKKDKLTFIGSYIDLKAYIPSSLDEETYLNNPKAAAFTWEQAKGFEQSKRGIFGISWHHQYNEQLKHITSTFSSFRNTYEPRPFNILSEATFAIGIRSRLLGKTKVFNKNLNWTFGGEFFKDWQESETFDNLYSKFPTQKGSVKGDKSSHFKENRNYYNFFFETNYTMIAQTQISLGLNFNKTSYKLDDLFYKGTNLNQSGTYTFNSIISPKLGISHILSENMTVYGNISHGFSPPTLQETLLPDGKINNDIKPESGWNFEIGTRGTFMNKRLQYNLAIYHMDLSNLLVARRTAQDEFIGVNAGRTFHKGLELSLNYQWIKSNSFSLSNYLSYTLNDYSFKDFIDGINDFSGNKLTGVPSQILSIGVDIDTNQGFWGSINFQYVDEIPITDHNDLFSKSYKLTDLKMGYRLILNKHLSINTYFGLNNLFNEVYASQILINAQSFNNKAPRYYYPGEPRNYYLGIQVTNKF